MVASLDFYKDVVALAKKLGIFILSDIAYAELYFTETLWPDFRKEDLYKAIVNYQQRERRFGKTSAQMKTQTEAKS